MAVKGQRTFESKYGTFTVGNHCVVSCETKRCDVIEGWNGTVCLAVSGGEALSLGHAFFYPSVPVSDREWMEETLGQGVARWAQAKLPDLHIATGDVINLYRSYLDEYKGVAYSTLSEGMFLYTVDGNALDKFVPDGVAPRWEDVPERAGRRDFWITRDLFEQSEGESEDPIELWHRILKAVVESRLCNWEDL